MDFFRKAIIMAGVEEVISTIAWCPTLACPDFSLATMGNDAFGFLGKGVLADIKESKAAYLCELNVKFLRIGTLSAAAYHAIVSKEPMS